MCRIKTEVTYIRDVSWRWPYSALTLTLPTNLNATNAMASSISGLGHSKRHDLTADVSPVISNFCVYPKQKKCQKVLLGRQGAMPTQS